MCVRSLAAATLLAAILLGAGGSQVNAQGRPHMAVAPSRPTGALGPLINIPQTWNNCGPVSVAEVLAYWGIQRTQAQVQAVLRADNSPGGMGPFGVPGYARSLGLRAVLGVEGTPALVKALISNGFPVIVNQWFSVADHVRHYRPIQSYDDRAGVFVASDPYGGANFAIPYADFAQLWTVSNNRFMVLYPPARQGLLDAVLASAGWNARRAYGDDLARQQARLKAHASLPGIAHMYGYLNLAWDELELGQVAAARQQLRQAAQHGANPIVITWISQQIPSRP